MTPAEREELISRYRASYSALLKALVPVGLAALDRAPNGEWTPRQIVHHIADTELLRSVRLRLLLAEDDPLIPSIDEPTFAKRLQYGRPVEPSLALIRAAMDVNLELLAGLSEVEWLRAGRHSEFGVWTVEDWLKRASAHAHEHAAQIVETAAAAKPT
jgi:hypothetical protein